MDIRSANQSDADSIIAFDPVAQSQRLRVNFIYRSITTRCCYVAADEKTAVAYGVLEYNFFENGFISTLFVHPDFRRQGIGCALVRHMEQACKTPKLFGSANQSNKPMQALYKKLGFRPSGTIKNLDEEDPELVFFKQLKENANT